MNSALHYMSESDIAFAFAFNKCKCTLTFPVRFATKTTHVSVTDNDIHNRGHRLLQRQPNVKLSKRSFTSRPLSFHYFSRFPEYYKSTSEVNATASVAIVTVTSMYPRVVLTPSDTRKSCIQDPILKQ